MKSLTNLFKIMPKDTPSEILQAYPIKIHSDTFGLLAVELLGDDGSNEDDYDILDSFGQYILCSRESQHSILALCKEKFPDKLPILNSASNALEKYMLSCLFSEHDTPTEIHSMFSVDGEPLTPDITKFVEAHYEEVTSAEEVAPTYEGEAKIVTEAAEPVSEIQRQAEIVAEVYRESIRDKSKEENKDMQEAISNIQNTTKLIVERLSDLQEIMKSVSINVAQTATTTEVHVEPLKASKDVSYYEEELQLLVNKASTANVPSEALFDLLLDFMNAFLESGSQDSTHYLDFVIEKLRGEM